MFVKITSVAALPDYILLVGFSTGEFKQFDIKPLIAKYPPFKALTQVNGLYEQVKIDMGGYGLVWNDELDLSADGLYEQGQPCQPPENIEKYKQELIEQLIAARKKSKTFSKTTRNSFGCCSTLYRKNGNGHYRSTINNAFENT